MSIQIRLEREIDLIKNDDSMSAKEKRREIREVERDYRDAARESSQRAYDEEYENW